MHGKWLPKASIGPHSRAGALLDDFRNEIQITFHERRIALVELVAVGFRHDVSPEALWPLERMRHRRNARRIAGFELVDHRDDARQLGRNVGDFSRCDLEAREPAKAFYVFGSKHEILEG
jgi:hypothetical protein